MVEVLKTFNVRVEGICLFVLFGSISFFTTLNIVFLKKSYPAIIYSKSAACPNFRSTRNKLHCFSFHE